MTLLHKRLAGGDTKLSYKQGIDILLLGFVITTAFGFTKYSGGKQTIGFLPDTPWPRFAVNTWQLELSGTFPIFKFV